MSVIRTSGRTVKTGSVVALFALMMGAVNALGAEPSSAANASISPARVRPEGPAAGPRYVPGEVIVKLKDGGGGGIWALSEDAGVQRDRATLLRLEVRYGVQQKGPVFKRVHEQLRLQALSPGGGRLGIASAGSLSRQADRLELLRFYVLQTPRSVPAVCAELKGDPDVEYAQPNYIYRICATPNDPDFPDQYAHQLIQMQKAWDISTGSRDVVVAIIDTGVDVNHPDLKENMWVNADEIPGNDIDDDENGYVDDIYGWNFGAGNNRVAPTGGSSSIASHGTQVAGVIAAVGDNGQGVSGVNWKCSIMALRMSLSFTSEETSAALDYAAANGAHVVNMSFGGDATDPELDEVFKTAIDNACAQGVLLVASAGNSDTSRAHYPAAYPNVMSVASTNGEDMKTGHSTFGLWVDIAAPGTDIVTTNLGNTYISTAGTSFSAPYVAAVAALLFSHRPALTHTQARAILENTTDPVYYGDLDPDLGYLGTGRVNAYQTLLGADRAYPLGEIAAPLPGQTFAADANAIELCLFVHGDSYELHQRLYAADDWILTSEGAAPADPNGLVHVSLPNPGVGTYELRLCVSRAGYTHTDRKVFGIEMASAQNHWPRPDKTVKPEDLWDEYLLGSPICMDVDGDGDNEIIQPSLDWSSLWGGGKVNIWGADGNSLPHWPVEFDAFWPTTVAIGDIDGDGDYELVAASEIDNAMYAYHVESGKIVGNWPVYFGSWYGYVSAGPVLADLDGDGDSEIIIALDAESSDSDGLYAFQGDGTPLWQRRYTSEGPISVADFDNDGDVEIGLCGYGPGLSRVYTFILDHRGQQLARWRGGSPKGTVVADLDADGTPEMVFCTEEEVMAVHVDGSTVWGKRLSDPLQEAGTLSVGDVDGDGLSEVYVATYIVEADGFAFTRLYGFDHQGRALDDAGFPRIVLGPPTGSVPLIADIDGDGQKELLFAPGGEPMIAWEADGSVTRGFPLMNLIADYEITPALADLDHDGDLELMVVADDYRFHVLDLPAPYAPELIDWGMSRHDPQNSRWAQAAPTLDPIAVPAEIQAGQRLQVQATASNPANGPLRWAVGNLPEGAYYDADSRTLFWKPAADQVFHTYRLSFLVTNGIRQDSRTLSVAVVPNAIYYTNMDTDPNWSLDEGWAWGAPAGKGSWKGDPSSGHTGDNVVGYALDGDYDDNLSETRYATIGPLDCAGYRNIRLSFWRWLGVEAPYDYACVQVSSDGLTWTDLWTTGPSHVSDAAWQLVEYAVPVGVADGQPMVYFRWGLGPTDDWVTYPGWNIDDVQVTGDPI